MLFTPVWIKIKTGKRQSDWVDTCVLCDSNEFDNDYNFLLNFFFANARFKYIIFNNIFIVHLMKNLYEK